VLQEVTVARLISVTCGASTLRDSVFRQGIKLLASFLCDEELYESQPLPHVQQLMSKTYPFRLHDTVLAEDSTYIQPSCTLALTELLDTFHNHAATDPRDKVYALLGLIANTGGPLRIKADYTKSWATLLHEVITQILGADVFVYTMGEKEQAVISGPGCPLGIITKHAETGAHSFRSPIFHGIIAQEITWTASLSESHRAKAVFTGDILCLLKGSHWPSVVRPCGDHFDIIVVAHPPPPLVFLEGSTTAHDTGIQTLTWKKFVECVSSFPRQFELVWDWDAEDIQIECSHDFVIELADHERTITEQERLLNTRVYWRMSGNDTN
jgi:hypothetical protein